jgi:hypothetical protein
MLYEVRGLPEGQKISIRNVRAQSHAPVWEIGRHSTGVQTVWAGVFSTGEEALAKLEAEIEAAVSQ